MTISKLIIVVTLILAIASVSAAWQQSNEAQIWNAWTNPVKDTYLKGFQEGAVVAYFKAGESWLQPGELSQKPETNKVKKARESIFLLLDIEVIRDVMSNLYEDPANQYVQIFDMVYIARDKLRGENIDEALRKARKNALELKVYKNKKK